jgi:hypothetical protein
MTMYLSLSPAAPASFFTTSLRLTYSPSFVTCDQHKQHANACYTTLSQYPWSASIPGPAGRRTAPWLPCPRMHGYMHGIDSLCAIAVVATSTPRSDRSVRADAWRAC